MARYAANGTILKIGTAGVEPATAVGDVETGEVDFGSTNMIPTVALGDSTGSMLPGTNDPIRVTGTIFLDPGSTVHDTLVDAKLGKTKISFGLYFPDTGAANIWSDGYVSEFSSPSVVDGALKASFTIQGTGAPTYTQ